MEKHLYAASIGAIVPSMLLLSNLEQQFIRELPAQCNAILDRELLLRAAAIRPHLECMGERGRELYHDFYKFDLVIYPLLYGMFLFGSVSRLWPNTRALWLLPLLGALADVLENFGLSFLLLQFPQQFPSVDVAISVFTRTKWLFLVLTAALLAAGGVRALATRGQTKVLGAPPQQQAQEHAKAA